LLNFPILLGSHKAKPREWSGSQAPKLCIYGGSGEIFSLYLANKICLDTVTQRAAQPKQKSELPQGAAIAPKP
jgi:hypothetical protein